MGAMVAEELLAYNCDVALLDENPLPDRLKREVRPIFGHADRLSEKRADIEAFKPDAVVHLETRNELHAHSFIETMDGIDSHLLATSSVNVYQANARVYRTEKVDLQDSPIGEESPLRNGTWPPCSSAVCNFPAPSTQSRICGPETASAGDGQALSAVTSNRLRVNSSAGV